MTGPAAALQIPEATDPLPGWIPFFLGGNYVSPAYYIGQAIQSITGTDVFGLASEFVAGDWAGVKQAADAAGNLAGFNAAFHDSLATEWQRLLSESWRGNAADQARGYFDHLAGGVEFQVRALREIERTLNNIGNSMLNLARLLGDLLQDIVDWTIMWLTEMAAAAVLSSTLVGAPGAAAAAAVAAAHAVMIFARFEQILTVTTGAFKTVVGLGATALELSNRPPNELPPLGTSTYDHPGV
ncbi:WXG100 family type VII secretion target [Nocardia brasiliensis]|uniref:WXG100 family type VII secretion target n=1 Tax=Nocardia brasiliensis TaxID=37326 RepID=UPI001893D206|nr:WXG100 family type VII secretion target [Nocardia brasiliensis]MBF6544543.1 WXG100 family type VII secretion target [Nocardia brasiliensis]